MTTQQKIIEIPKETPFKTDLARAVLEVLFDGLETVRDRMLASDVPLSMTRIFEFYDRLCGALQIATDIELRILSLEAQKKPSLGFLGPFRLSEMMNETETSQDREPTQPVETQPCHEDPCVHCSECEPSYEELPPAGTPIRCVECDVPLRVMGTFIGGRIRAICPNCGDVSFVEPHGGQA